jgi:hypothetical protein
MDGSFVSNQKGDICLYSAKRDPQPFYDKSLTFLKSGFGKILVTKHTDKRMFKTKI